jgi:hypothetical protein
MFTANKSDFTAGGHSGSCAASRQQSVAVPAAFSEIARRVRIPVRGKLPRTAGWQPALPRKSTLATCNEAR